MAFQGILPETCGRYGEFSMFVGVGSQKTWNIEYSKCHLTCFLGSSLRTGQVVGDPTSK